MTCAKCGALVVVDAAHERERFAHLEWHIDSLRRCLNGHTQPMDVCRLQPRELDVRGVAQMPRAGSGVCSRCQERFPLTRRRQQLCDDCRMSAFAGRWRRR